MTSNYSRIFALLTLLVFPALSYAELSDLKVYTPLVEKGNFAFEVLGNTVIDGNAELGGFQYHEFEFEYGVTDWWASSLTNSLVVAPIGGLKYNVFGWENTFQLTEEGRYWLDFGVHIELEFDDEKNESDQVEVRLMFRKSSNVFEHIFNLNFEQDFGSQARESLELEYIWRSKIRITEYAAAGFELYGALGEVKDFEPLKEQEHIIGPAFYYDFDFGEIEVESHLVWLFGLTGESADHTFRWQLEFEF